MGAFYNHCIFCFLVALCLHCFFSLVFLSPILTWWYSMIFVHFLFFYIKNLSNRFLFCGYHYVYAKKKMVICTINSPFSSAYMLFPFTCASSIFFPSIFMFLWSQIIPFCAEHSFPNCKSYFLLFKNAFTSFNFCYI